MKTQRVKKLVELFSGISWSLLTFGTFFIFSFTILNSSIFVAIIATFSTFFIIGINVLFLESLKIQIEQNDKIEEILNKLQVDKQNATTSTE